MGILKNGISQCCLRNRNSYKGFGWCYPEEGATLDWRAGISTTWSREELLALAAWQCPHTHQGTHQTCDEFLLQYQAEKEQKEQQQKQLNEENQLPIQRLHEMIDCVVEFKAVFTKAVEARARLQLNPRTKNAYGLAVAAVVAAFFNDVDNIGFSRSLSLTRAISAAIEVAILAAVNQR